MPTSITVGPDGALHVGTLSGEPYPDGNASVIRIANPTVTTGFNGTIASGVPQVYASGRIRRCSIPACSSIHAFDPIVLGQAVIAQTARSTLT